MEKFGSVQFSTLNLQMLNRTIHSVWQFSGTLNGMWCSGSKSIQFTFECSLNTNVSWDPLAGVRAPVWHSGSSKSDPLHIHFLLEEMLKSDDVAPHK